jgi:hypothetical protein
LWYNSFTRPNPKRLNPIIVQLPYKEGFMGTEKDIEFKVGRRLFDGTIRLSSHPPQLVQLSVCYKGERASSVMLTREQVQTLMEALAGLEQSMGNGNDVAEDWDSHERREGNPEEDSRKTA